MKEKLSLLFNNYELDQLSSMQYSYLFAKGRISLLPSFNEILKATLLYTYIRTRDGRVSKRFANSFLKKRRLPPNEEPEILDKNKITDVLETDSSEIIQVSKTTYTYQKASSYSFFLDENEMKQVQTLKERVSRDSDISVRDISNPEIAREALHFVVDDTSTNLGFRYITYIGYLYGFRPVVSIIIGEMEREKYDFDELAELFAYTAERAEFHTLNEMHKDKKTFDKFSEKFQKYPNMSNGDHLKEMVGKFKSEIGNFDFYLALVGAEMTFFTGKFKLSEIPDAVLYMIVNEKRASFTKDALSLFEYFMKYFYDFSENYEVEYMGKK